MIEYCGMCVLHVGLVIRDTHIDMTCAGHHIKAQHSAWSQIGHCSLDLPHTSVCHTPRWYTSAQRARSLVPRASLPESFFPVHHHPSEK